MQGEVKIHDKIFEPYLPAEQIRSRITEIAVQMNDELADENPLFLAVLNGSFFFASDLMKELDFLCEISFVKLSSYNGTRSSGDVRTLIGLNEKIVGRNIVILEDIIDTGITIDKLINELLKYNPSSVQIATLTLKKEALQKPVTPRYVGFEVPDKFLVGYGLDYNQLGRNLKDIYKLKKDNTC